jgi:hypothetical protein
VMRGHLASHRRLRTATRREVACVPQQSVTSSTARTTRSFCAPVQRGVRCCGAVMPSTLPAWRSPREKVSWDTPPVAANRFALTRAGPATAAPPALYRRHGTSACEPTPYPRPVIGMGDALAPVMRQLSRHRGLLPQLPCPSA